MRVWSEYEVHYAFNIRRTRPLQLSRKIVIQETIDINIMLVANILDDC